MYLIFDTETTGLPKSWNAPVEDKDNWPRMVQLAWVQCDASGKEIARHSYIIKPEGFTIPSDVVKIHGITTERAIKEGTDLKKVLMEFSKAISDSTVLVAHNMSFDEKIVGAEFLRANIGNRLFETRRICTQKLSTDFCKLPGPYGYKWPSLPELHSVLFKDDFKEAHDAAIDAVICSKCFFALKERGVIS